MAGRDSASPDYFGLTLPLVGIARPFGRDKSVISRNPRNVFQTGELERESVVARNATTRVTSTATAPFCAATEHRASPTTRRLTINPLVDDSKAR
jgi:hypothetical protein